MCFKYPGRKEATQRDPCNPPFHIQTLEIIPPKE